MPPFLLNFAGFLVFLAPFSIMIGPVAIEICMGLISLLFLIHQTKEKDWDLLRHAWVKGALVLWGSGVLANGIVHASVNDVFQALLWGRFVLFAFALAFWILPHPYWRNRLLFSISAATCFVILNCLIQYGTGYDLFGHQMFNGIRLTAVFGKPVSGVFLASFFAPVFFAFLEKEAPFKGALYGFLCLLTILLSGERYALLSCLLSLGVYTLLLSITKNKKFFLFFPLTLVVTAILLGQSPALYDRFVTATTEIVTNLPASHYGRIWSRGIKMVKENPVVGVGVTQYPSVCRDPLYGPAEDASPLPPCATHPHNIYLDWQIKNGLMGSLGFLVFLIFLGQALYTRLKENKRAFVLWGASIAIVTKLLPFVPMTSFYHAWGMMPLWLCIGLALSYPVSSSRLKPPV